ncbi:hypothetical protein C9Y88_17650 [Escherichia coli]|nr:hypothetical protein ECRM9131_01500 [Escherichia coli]KDV14153.1 hypothetical protein BW73_30170 [Escherichia coli O111:NM str. 01-3076]AWZ55660.1 hypothetical protein ECRM9975_01500 [Escherichia coli]EFI6643184.1 hypothetical protein [Escherichia coli]EFI6646159.1 hypothetical protein [Escherichia coli]
MRRKRLIRTTNNTACGRCCAFCGRLFSARPETPFPPDRKRHFRLFFNLLIIHIKNIGTPFANNLTSLSGVINDQPKNHCARNRVCGCRHSGGKLAGEANRAGC